MSHDEFRSARGADGLWRTRCKTCGWVGPGRAHVLDTGPDTIQHSTEQPNHNPKGGAPMRQHYRQGDILLIPIDHTPPHTKTVNRENGKLILAHGEITGHHHAFNTDVTNVELVTAEEANQLYLMVYGTKPAPLTHQEHATIDVAPGVYEVRRQREYAPEEIRQVAD